MKLPIIIPVFNELKTIEEVIDRVKATNLGDEIVKEIIVVDDRSTDKTREILKELASEDKMKIFTHKKNSGKGTAVRTGIKKSTGEVVLIQDADLEYYPSDYPKLLEPLIKGEAKVVYGARIGLKVKPEFYLSFLGNKLLTWSTDLLFRSKP